MVLLGYRDGPPPHMAGGSGDATCHMCHSDSDINAGPGSFAIEGIPTAYQPGETYTVTVRLEDPDLEAAGFQLVARDEAGGQAGSWRSLDEATQTVASRQVDGLSFVQQTLGGSTFDRKAEWRMEWTAPEPGVSVRISGAANASNNDASPLGDRIYTLEMRVGAE